VLADDDIDGCQRAARPEGGCRGLGNTTLPEALTLACTVPRVTVAVLRAALVVELPRKL